MAAVAMAEGTNTNRVLFRSFNSRCDSLRRKAYISSKRFIVALNVLEVCLGILDSAEAGHPVDIESRFAPPAPLVYA